MRRNKIIKILVSLGLVATILSGIFTVKFLNKKNKDVATAPIVITEQEEERTIDYSEAIVNELQKVNQIRVLQSSLIEKVNIKNSKYDNKLFKNNTIITVKGNGNYYVDLSNIKDDVIVKGNDVYIVCTMKTEVNLNEKDITIETEKGLLSLYNKHLEAEDYNNILCNVKAIMLEKAKDEDYIETAKEKAEENIETIIDTIVGDNTVKLHFLWK